MGELTTKFPWEPSIRSTDDTVKAIQADLAYIVTHTAVLVHSTRNELAILINTKRGQIIPHGVCKYTDGTTMEFQDIGMPQIGAPEMSVKDLVAYLWGVANDLGLELVQ